MVGGRATCEEYPKFRSTGRHNHFISKRYCCIYPMHISNLSSRGVRVCAMAYQQVEMQSPERVAEDMLAWYRTVCHSVDVRVSVKRMSQTRAHMSESMLVSFAGVAVPEHMLVWTIAVVPRVIALA